jgi:hypothetical protein
MKKLSKLAQQFPNIFRIIPESNLVKKIFKSKHLFYITSAFVLCVSLIFLVGIVVVGINIYNNVKTVTSEIGQRQEIQNKINFWQSIADKYQGYKDAYFQIAVLEYNLGDLEKAKQANTKALILDPNFEEAKKLGELLK